MTDTNGADKAVSELQRELAGGDPDRLARAVAWLTRTIRLVAIPVMATGAVAAVLWALAWRDRPLVAALGALASLPAVVLPFNATRRCAAVAAVGANPSEAIAQARDLLGRVAEDPGLAELATAARRLTSGGNDGPVSDVGGLGRLRSGVRVVRLTGNLVEAAQPDPQRHSLLVPLHPERLGKLWRGLAWCWPAFWVAVVIAFVGAGVTIANAI